MTSSPSITPHGRAVAAVTLDALPDHWRLSRLALRVALPPGFEVDEALPARLRGTLGHALLARSDDADYAAARRILFEPVAWRDRAMLPKPFAIAADEEGGALRIVLTLFGRADRWRRPIFDAMVEGLEAGVAVHGRDGAPRRPLPVFAADWTRSETIVVPRATRSARLRFRTPLRLGGGRTLGQRWSDVIVSLAERAAGLAAWQGLDVDPCLGDWRRLADKLSYDDSNLGPVAWTRRSGAQRGRAIAMAGFIGSLDIAAPPECLMPLLALGETTHVGGGASLGLGRYDLL